MWDRMRALWIPALVTLILSVTLHQLLGKLPLLQRFVPTLSFLQGSRQIGPVDVILNLWYLAGLVLIGALAAWWSWRAGGERSDRVAVALMPALWEAVAVAALTVKGVLAGPRPPWALVASGFVDRAVIPGVALLVGALPFLRHGMRPAPKVSS